MLKTTHGRVLNLNGEPLFNGFVTVATSDLGNGVFRAERNIDQVRTLPTHQPLILEDEAADQVIVVEKVVGNPPVAYFVRASGR